MARYVVLIVAFVGLVLVLSMGLRKDPSELPSPFLNKAAPAFDLPTLENPDQNISLADIKGKIALVNVWATWCVGCREEHAYLMQLAKSGQVPIYGINWRDSRADAARWLEQYGDPYVASGFDEDGRVGIDWGVYGAPETFLLDAHGTVLYKHLGPLSPAAWERDFLPKIKSAESAL
ncbi:MAG TPA: DsbE family thiol:disulfide interchange protein [Woeseiaceae bacterium]|nr:DsbE family thiol:disulfide interchange protein [Woeseiaceae bacterium]